MDERKLIHQAVEILKSGGVILYPSDTIAGLGCDATNATAIEKIFEIKKRPANKSLIILVANDAMLNKYVEEVPELAWDIMDLSTKPTTIIYPKAKNLAKNAVAADGSIAIRMVKSGFCNRLIHAFGKPIVSTSANISNLPAPIYVTEVADEIKNQVDLVIDIDTVAQTKPSAIIKIEMDGTIKVIRK